MSAGPDGSILEPRLASSSLRPHPLARVSSVSLPALPSCIRFLLELVNVTLEGAAAPQASSSPPPFAVVGCGSGCPAPTPPQLVRTQHSAYPNRRAGAESAHAGQPLSLTPHNSEHGEAHCTTCISPSVHGPLHPGTCSLDSHRLSSSPEPLSPTRIYAHSPAARDGLLASFFFFFFFPFLLLSKYPYWFPAKFLWRLPGRCIPKASYGTWCRLHYVMTALPGTCVSCIGKFQVPHHGLETNHPRFLCLHFPFMCSSKALKNR